MLAGTRPSRFAKAALVLPVFLAIAMALPDHLLSLVCRSGAVMDVEACCPSADVPSSRLGAGQALRDEACCSLRAVDLDRATSEAPGQSRGPRVALAAFVALPAGALAPAHAAARSLPPPVAPPSLGPPLVLLKHAFLL